MTSRLWPAATVLLSAIAQASAEPITFDQALGLASGAPRPEAARRAAAAKREMDERISALTFNPQIAVQPGFRLAPETAREPEVVAEIIQPWNLDRHGGARRRTVRAEEAWAETLTRAALLQQRLAVARAWIDRWSAQEVLEAAMREQAVVAELERLVAKTAEAGAATRADVADVRALHGEARLLVLAAEGESYNRGLALASAIGRDGAVPVVAAGLLPEPPLPALKQARQAIDGMLRLPTVEARALESEAARLRAIEERAARGHVLQTGVVVQRDAPGGLVLSGMLRWTPPLFDRGERERGVWVSDAARLDGEHKDAAVRARADFAMALHEVEHTAEVLVELRDRFVPASEEAAEARRRIFAAGEGTIVEVLQSQRTAISAASRLARARADHAWARIRLWLLLTALERAKR